MPSPQGWGSSWGFLWGSPGTTEIDSITSRPSFPSPVVHAAPAVGVLAILASGISCRSVIAQLLVNGPTTIETR